MKAATAWPWRSVKSRTCGRTCRRTAPGRCPWARRQRSRFLLTLGLECRQNRGPHSLDLLLNSERVEERSLQARAHIDLEVVGFGALREEVGDVGLQRLGGEPMRAGAGEVDVSVGADEMPGGYLGVGGAADVGRAHEQDLQRIARRCGRASAGLAGLVVLHSAEHPIRAPPAAAGPPTDLSALKVRRLRIDTRLGKNTEDSPPLAHNSADGSATFARNQTISGSRVRRPRSDKCRTGLPLAG